MPTVVLKFFAIQGTGQTEGQTGQSSHYMLPPLGSIKTELWKAGGYYN